MEYPPNRPLRTLRQRLFKTPLRAVTTAAATGVTLYVSGVIVYLESFAGEAVPLPVYLIPAAALLPLLKWAVEPASGMIFQLLPAVGWSQKRRHLLRQRAVFIRKLTPVSGARYNVLQNSVQRLGGVYPAPPEKGSLLRPGEYLLWLYLKLLLARDHLEANTRESRPAELRRQLEDLESEMTDPELTPAARESKEETVVLLRQRLSAIKFRGDRMREVESDLTRIEHKIALLYDEAVRHNPLSAAGLRISLPVEALRLHSLSSSADGAMEQLDGLMTAQLSAH